MNLEFTGRHIDVTPALRTHVEDHFARIENVFDGREVKAHVIIEVERGIHRSEIIINWRNETLTAVSSNSDMYQSLAQSVSKIEKQARKLKDKVIGKSHRATKAAIVAIPPDPIDELLPVTGTIIEVNGLDAKPMSPDEAVMELETSDNQFLVFRNSEGGKAAVVFKRNDGNYGLVRP